MINLTKENAHDSADNDFFRWNIDGIEIWIQTYANKDTLRIAIRPNSLQGTLWTFDSLQDDHIMGEDAEEVEFLPASLQPFFTETFDMDIYKLASILVDYLLNDED